MQRDTIKLLFQLKISRLTLFFQKGTDLRAVETGIVYIPTDRTHLV